MYPIQILLEEHQLIYQALENVVRAIEMIESGKKVSLFFFEKWDQFYRSFILNHHHFKEEYVLFRELAQKQNGAIDAQVDALRYQHDRGRDIMNQVNGSLPGYIKDDPNDTILLLENLAAYVSLIRHHIHREEQVYYPMIVNLFSESEKKGLAEAMQVENEKVPSETRGHFREIVDEMGKLIVR